MGRTLEDYLEAEGRTEEDLDRELAEAAGEALRVQIVLDTLADAEDVQVSDDEFGREVIGRAQRAGMGPPGYYEQLVRSGAAGALFADVRRNKALGMLLERVTVTDSAGEPVNMLPEAPTQTAGGRGRGRGDDRWRSRPTLVEWPVRCKRNLWWPGGRRRGRRLVSNLA